MNKPPTCPHFSLCSGCQLHEELYNPPLWKEALAFFHQHGLSPPLITQGFSQTRLKAKLAVRPGPRIGLFKQNTHEVIPIPHCLVHHPAINRAVAIIQEEILHSRLTPYSESTSTGLLKYIQLFVEQSTGRIQLTLIATHSRLHSFCERLLKHNLWHSIWINVQPDRTNRILGDTWDLIHGEPYLWQTINRTPIAFHPGAFSQAHLPLFEKMVQKIASWTRPDDTILELYAGVGAISLALQATQVTLVESNPFAHLSYQQTAQKHPYYCMDAKEADPTGYSLIIVDPPRKGLDPLLLQKLSRLPSGRLIYVSCGFDRFKIDVSNLISNGWVAKEAAGYLLFPGTNHVEILSLFEKH